MKQDYNRRLGIENANAGIYNQYTGQKLGADQYNADRDLQAQDFYLRGKAKRREGRREAFKNIAESGQTYNNDKMYQTWLDKTFGK